MVNDGIMDLFPDGMLSTDWHFNFSGEDPEGSLSWFMVHPTREGMTRGFMKQLTGGSPP